MKDTALLLRDAVRLFVLKTSSTPLRRLYVACYHFAIWAVTRRLRSIPGVVAIYLRRGCARDEIIPGISDIDFGVFATTESLLLVRKRYQQCARVFPMLEEMCELYTPERYRHYFSNHLLTHTRQYEEQYLWKRLYGRDCVSQLTDFDPQMLRWGLYFDIWLWWSLFINGVIPAGTSFIEKMESRALCYKVVAELARFLGALKTGKIAALRWDALQQGKEILGALGCTLTDRLEAQYRTRFLSPDVLLPEDTVAFYLRLYDRLNRMPEYVPPIAPVRDAALRFDSPWEEWGISEEDRAIFLALAQKAQMQWAGFLGAALSPSAMYDLQDVVLIFSVNTDRLPSLQDLKEMQHLAQTLCAGMRWEVHLVLQLETGMLRFGYVAETKKPSMLASRATLGARFYPDIATLGASPDFLLLGAVRPSTEPPVWGLFQERYLTRWRKQNYWEPALYLGEAHAGETNARQFLSCWWKALQLSAIEWNCYSGEPIVLPLTVPAICRALERMGFSLPDDLLPFATVFWQSEEILRLVTPQRRESALRFFHHLRDILEQRE